jgi:hypothetical protein
MKIKIKSFEDWVKYVFDHPVYEQKQQWYFEVDAPHWNEEDNPAATVSYITQLFQNAADVCKPYSDAQLNQGFWFLVSNAGSNHMFTLLSNRVPVPDRERCIQSMVDVFRDLFGVRCSHHLSHTLRTYDSAVNPLNSACYMWWDIIPIGGSQSNDRWLNEACLDVMEQTLQLKSIACQESALHGLGHWQVSNPERVQGIIDRFLKANPNIVPALKTYALSARGGCVL